MNVRLKRDFTFTAGIYYDGRVQMNNYNLRLWLMTNTYNPEDHNTAFERLKYFLYNEIDSTVFINSAHLESCQRISSAGFKITTLPGEPVDQLVGIMLFYKLNSIMENRMLIVETELSSMLGDSMCYLHSDQENSDDLDKPEWWASNDLLHCDLDLIKTDKVVTMHQTTTWRDLNLHWTDVEADTNNNDNTVVFADFKRDETK